MEVITILIYKSEISILERFTLILWNMLQPWFKIRILIEEIKDWTERGILNTREKKARYLLDHFVLWYFYVLFWILTGREVRGLFSWSD